MYSCGLDGERRKQDIQNLLATNNQTDSTFCDQEESIYGISSKLYRQVLNENQERIEEGFFNIGYWISTIASLGIGIFWGVISAGLSFYNTQESPALSLLGIFGLYIWNALAGASEFLLFRQSWHLYRNAMYASLCVRVYDDL